MSILVARCIDRPHSERMKTNTNIAHLIGNRVTIVAPDDASDVMHVGTAVGVAPSGEWVSVCVDGETVVHEWPTERVFAADEHTSRYA